ncbi:16S rRNA (guanine(966)-N(2))-methyltransferase RsmD [Neobittarella massiliensis]|uniref:16S rRNA (Guanine(966)-N(2))-methyltransferase RsmD n=3 Tax=Oscillospiraceae TaxID=216572 RepID=A0A8J6IQC3_9FIRM|nr:16S rRNA (guanine(966)-N(2))-methyltransferase RsmD [Neobittarella massiliensis]SCJ89693.1 Ribosomal RNA small subunit methyltransferase D [uncultured Anaerotruncus sp.]
MRVITGSARGTRLQTLEGLSVRPTTDRVKEGLFSSIHFLLPGARVLDLFAGSGQLGIEALSRGAASCVFVDQDRTAHQVVRDNLRAAKLEKQARVIQSEALTYLHRCRDSYDLVFVDPPYACGLYGEILAALEPCVAAGGLVTVESDRDEPLPPQVGQLQQQKRRRYGKITITTYQKGERL